MPSSIAGPSRPTVWIDTNVVLDFYTHIRPYENQVAGDVALEGSRMLMQDAAWLAMSLDEEGATTASFQHEALRNMLERAPPGTEIGSWTGAIVWILRQHVCPRWNVMVTRQGELILEGSEQRPTTNDERDQIMVDLAKEDGLTVVTRDRGARRRCREAGVPVFKPAAYAERALSREAAGSRFLARLEAGLSSFAAENPAITDPTSVLEVYRALWSAPA
jgi:hypothetical protein